MNTNINNGNNVEILNVNANTNTNEPLTTKNSLSTQVPKKNQYTNYNETLPTETYDLDLEVGQTAMTSPVTPGAIPIETKKSMLENDPISGVPKPIQGEIETTEVKSIPHPGIMSEENVSKIEQEVEVSSPETIKEKKEDTILEDNKNRTTTKNDNQPSAQNDFTKSENSSLVNDKEESQNTSALNPSEKTKEASVMNSEEKVKVPITGKNNTEHSNIFDLIFNFFKNLFKR